MAIGLEFAHAIDARGMLGFLLLAVCLFWIGRLIEGYLGPRA